ncbi:MAG: hypothetical protein NDI61_02595 [Bdellovibrionaceae bacterium]|nr:hypothetical protein [Pseudobdellovibrionaceae bacterium]
MMVWVRLLLFLMGSGAIFAHAQVEHQLIRRFVVFPIQSDLTLDSASSSMTGSGSRSAQEKVAAATLDEAWWQVREELTNSRRFLIASKQFLIKHDVYQPRGPLEPADAVILGKLLDAHALVTAQVKGRVFSMQVFDGGNGLPLWRRDYALHPSLTVADQVVSVATKLIDDFMASVPYQGFTHVDPLVGRAVFEEGDVLLTQVDVGVAARVQTGDPVQWMQIAGTTVAPLFQGGSRMRIFAEGRIVKVEQGIAAVELTRATNINEIKEFSLVRLPREAERLQAEYLIKEGVRSTFSAELVAPEMSPMEQLKRERRPLATTMSWVSSLAAFLLLAF